MFSRFIFIAIFSIKVPSRWDADSLPRGCEPSGGLLKLLKLAGTEPP